MAPPDPPGWSAEPAERRLAPRNLRIAQVCIFIHSIPHLRYGAPGRALAPMVDELAARGHDVTLFASETSRTRARHRVWPVHEFRWQVRPEDFAPEVLDLYRPIAAEAGSYDAIHVHTDLFQHFEPMQALRHRMVSTPHYWMDFPELAAHFERFADQNFVSISRAQRSPWERLNWVGTMHYGIPRGLLRLDPRPGEKLAFIGRTDRDKRLDRAIRIAKACGRRLKLAVAHLHDSPYHSDVLKPLIDDPCVDFHGTIGDADKQDFFADTLALLFPIDWNEPFGMVMVEAMAAGTPVVAWPNGAAREVVEPGVTGFHAASVAEAVRAVDRCAALDRAQVRAAFERRFSTERMADDCERLYAAIADGRAPRLPD